MSKSIKVTNGADLQQLMEQHTNVSLRKLSLELEVNYGAILKASKAPIPGAVYDPEAINYDEVATQFAKRNKDFNKLDWTVLDEAPSKATLTKNLDEFEVGDKVYIRKYPTTPYNIIYKTETHIVIMLEGTSEPQAWSHSTLIYNGPSKEPRESK